MDAGAIIDAASRILFGEPNRELSTKTELRFRTKGSLAVNVEKGTWFDYEDNVGGGYLDFVRRHAETDDPAAWLRANGLVEEKKTARPKGRARNDGAVSTFDYVDEEGKLLYQVYRVDYPASGDQKKSKTIRQRRPDPNAKDGWIWSLGTVRRVLYRLPELVAAEPLAPVFVVEGEPKVEALRKMGAVATCNAGGANKWLDKDKNDTYGYPAFFKGRDVVILPDNDAPGSKHARTIARLLFPTAARVRVVMLPGLGDGEDVIQWIERGGTASVLADLVDSAEDWKPNDDGGDAVDGAPEFSEMFLATRLADRHADDLRYVDAWGKWYRWIGSHWRVDETLEAFELSRRVCQEASTKINNVVLARSVASAKTRAAVLSLAREDRKIAASPGQWDADPWILCTPGGTVDLRTGTVRENRPEDYATRITAVAPGGSGDGCELWLAFLDKITAGDEGLKSYLKRTCGYVLTGDTSEHALFFLYGLGSNGKSKFVEAISGVLGDYHTVAQIETFTSHPNDRHPTEIAQLRGARLVTATETEEGRRWAEARIKSLTGGDRISARFMRQDFFEFTPEFKLMIFGNHKPSLKTVDAAMRRRMNMVPFNVTITEAEMDKELGNKLRVEWPGILRWMIEGCLEWRAEGLRPPAVVVEATDQYLDQEDTFKIWFDESCMEDPNAFTPTTWLFTSWKRWAERSNEYVGTLRRFVQRLESSGYKSVRSRLFGSTKANDTKYQGYRGIKLAGQLKEGTVDELPF